MLHYVLLIVRTIHLATTYKSTYYTMLSFAQIIRLMYAIKYFYPNEALHQRNLLGVYGS